MPLAKSSKKLIEESLKLVLSWEDSVEADIGRTVKKLVAKQVRQNN